MVDFSEFVKRRRAELLKELMDLDAAERVYRASLGAMPSRTLHDPAAKSADSKRTTTASSRTGAPTTIKAMIKVALSEHYLEGLTAQDILREIRSRWLPNLERTSLSPQLSRLRKAETVFNRNSRWFLSTSTS